jgi:hypothetical protein
MQLFGIGDASLFEFRDHGPAGFICVTNAIPSVSCLPIDVLYLAGAVFLHVLEVLRHSFVPRQEFAKFLLMPGGECDFEGLGVARQVDIPTKQNEYQK